MVMYPWMYIVLLGLVLIVYARFLPTAGTNSLKGNVIQEIEETMEHFAADMEEQNRTLLETVSDSRKDYETQLAKLNGRIEFLEQQGVALSQGIAKLSFSPSVQQSEQTQAQTNFSISEKQPRIQLKPNEIMNEPDDVHDSQMKMKIRYSDLFALYDQGKSIEYIAKKLEMNKGEVNLIIQLAKQEDMQNV